MTLFSSSSMAEQVPVSVSRQAAANFWNTYRPVDVKGIVPAELQQITLAEMPMLHVWAVGENGFVIVSASDRVAPVLAYSFNSPATRDVNPEAAFWLKIFNSQIQAAEQTPGYMAEGAAAQWNSLLTSPVPPTPVNSINVPQLVSTRWNQSEPYNNYCPYDSVRHTRAVVGCVATAMAQVMKYWNHPSSGEGYHSYEHHSMDGDISYGMLDADFGNTTYIWEYMPNTVDNIVSLPYQIDAIALLSYHCGVAVDMMYGISADGGSGAYSSCGWWAETCAESAFRDNFKYSPDLLHRQRHSSTWRDTVVYDTLYERYDSIRYAIDVPYYTDSEWCALIDSNLALGAPLYYSGSDYSSGHAFVLDGSDTSGRYHFNWGWGGAYDGYFTINHLAPGAGGDGTNVTNTFSHDQGAIFGIIPVPEQFDSVVLYDTICNNQTNYYFHGYNFPAQAGTYQAIHLDTVFTIHLTVSTVRRLYLDANGGSGNPYNVVFCPTDGVIMPRCNFHRQGYEFIGWGMARYNNDTLYQPDQHLALRINKTMYAIWQDTTTPPPADTTQTDTTAIFHVDGGEVKVWPNVVAEKVNISVDNDPDATIVIIDSYGRVVINRKTIAGKAVIPLNRLPSGSYTVMVITSDAKYNTRIIKI